MPKIRAYTCTIELDTDRTIENMTACLTEEFNIYGGMSISQDRIMIIMRERNMSHAMCGLHTIAKLFTSPNGGSYTVSIWESGNK